MNLQEKLSAIQAETAAANARAAACEREKRKLDAKAAKMEAEIRNLLSAPNFPEEAKQRILARLAEIRSME